MAKKTARNGAVVNGSQCQTMSIPEAGWHYYGLGRNGSYAFAKERPDLLPTITVRGKKRASVAVMDLIMESVGKGA